MVIAGAEASAIEGGLDVSLFGTLTVRCGDRALGPSSFGGVKPKVLLEMLLLARGHLVSKDTLAEALWPDRPPKNVCGTLETYVSVLRRSLFDDRVQARRVLVTASGAYRLAPDEVRVDLDRFDDLLLLAEQAAPRGRRTLWMDAVALATGDLLEDEPYAPWVQTERELYRGRVARTHLLIAESALFEGEVDVALRHGEAALASNPFAEEAFRVVMLANHTLGHVETARQVYARCREVLDRELGVDPSTELVDLAGAIDAGTPPHELVMPFRHEHRHEHRHEPGAPTGRRHRDRRDPARQLPFLGRAAELTRLREHVHASRRGEFRLVLVEGRSGFGRTTLLDRLHSSLAGTVGRAAYSSRDLEYPSLPFAAALRDALRTPAAADEAVLYATAPLLSGAGAALGSLLGLVTRHGPLVLLLDDLQWADPDTFAALDWLARRASDVPLAIVATARGTTSGSGADLARLRPDDRIRLRALTTADARPALGADHEIVLAAGGNPRLMADIWRWRRSGRSDLPPSLDEAVKRRVRGLGGTAPALLQAAAVLPEPFGPIDLTDGAERARAVVAGLQQLCDLAFLEATNGGLRFVEPVVRDVLATITPPSPLPRRTPVPVRHGPVPET